MVQFLPANEMKNLKVEHLGKVVKTIRSKRLQIINFMFEFLNGFLKKLEFKRYNFNVLLVLT